MFETQSGTAGAQHAIKIWHLRRFCEDYFICKQPRSTESQHFDADVFGFLFCFVSIFLFLKGMLRIIMGNFKNQAQMRRSRTDVLLCSLILTWLGAPAENIPGAGAELKQAKQQNQRSWRCCTKAAQSREPSWENDETKPNTSNSSHSQTFRVVSWSWRHPEIDWFVDLLKVWQIHFFINCVLKKKNS